MFRPLTARQSAFDPTGQGKVNVCGVTAAIAF
jgi:hypothetical protein